jgi:hypothetical protein
MFTNLIVTVGKTQSAERSELYQMVRLQYRMLLGWWLCVQSGNVL